MVSDFCAINKCTPSVLQVDGWFTGTGSLCRYINEPTLQTFDLSAVQKVFTGEKVPYVCYVVCVIK